MRRRSSADLAEALDLDLRSYERLEAGGITLSVPRLVRIARFCDADPMALLAALEWDRPELATATADNKLFELLALAVERLPEPARDALSQASPASVLDALTACLRNLGRPGDNP